MFLFIQATSNIDIESFVEEKEQLQPYILVVERNGQIFLFVDCQLVTELTLDNVPFILFCVFFCYNIWV